MLCELVQMQDVRRAHRQWVKDVFYRPLCGGRWLESIAVQSLVFVETVKIDLSRKERHTAAA